MSYQESLKTRQLALLKGNELDVPKKTRAVIFVAAVIGIGLVVIGSLSSGGKAGHIQTDKLIHLGGYATLAFVLVVSLRPRLFIPGLVGLVVMGVVIEALQGKTGRSTDAMDAVANSIGVGIGAAGGLIARFVLTWIRTEAALSKVRESQVSFRPGQAVIRQGDPATHCWLVRSGRVALLRERDGTRRTIDEVGPSDLIGVLGLIRGEPSFVTGIAMDPATLVKITLDDILPSEEGDVRHPSAVVTTALADLVADFASRLEAAGVPLSDIDHPSN